MNTQKSPSSSADSSVPSFNQRKIWLPIVLGLGVIVWLFGREFDLASLQQISFTWHSVLCILLAFVCIFCRDFGLIWRFRAMTDNRLSWRQAFHVHILSEFTSAVTPSAVGGSALVVFFLNKEGVSAARSTTIMFANLILDELFFVVCMPILFVLLPISDIFNSTSAISGTIATLFWIVYAIITAWTLFLFVVLFYKSSWLKPLARLLCRIPFFRRRQHHIDAYFEQLTSASADIRRKPKHFWVVAFGATVLSWMARFLVVNALFMAFTSVSNHLVVFARQVLLWVVMIVSPTPGGSGLSEFAFKEYYSDLALSSSAILLIILIWRFISYYLYLFIGAVVIPRWLSSARKSTAE